jgi:hypothetical protein
MVSESKKRSKTSGSSPTKATTQPAAVVKLSKDEIFNVSKILPKFPHLFTIFFISLNRMQSHLRRKKKRNLNVKCLMFVLMN